MTAAVTVVVRRRGRLPTTEAINQTAVFAVRRSTCPGTDRWRVTSPLDPAVAARAAWARRGYTGPEPPTIGEVTG